MLRSTDQTIKMSAEEATQTRLQYVYIEVSIATGNVVNPVTATLSGPTEVIQRIKSNFHPQKIFGEVLGGSMKITVYGCDATFMKATFLEEVLKYGFVHEDTWSNIMKTDFIVLSRQVKRQ